MANVFIAYDFEIKHGLTSHFEYVKRKKPDHIEWPGNFEDKPQGEIWRNFVRPKLDASPRFIAFVDLPNANVGYEIGYALGHGAGKEAALATMATDLPAWLELPPLNGLFCQRINKGQDLLNLIDSKNWFKSPPRPKSGEKILFLCQLDGIGYNYHDLVKEEFNEWQHLNKDGWSFNDIHEKLKDVGLIVWLILPHNEGQNARDGSENAATAVIAGYAEAAGVDVKVLRHKEARKVADVVAKAIEFSSEKELLAQLARLEKEFRERLKSVVEADQTTVAKSILTRPDVGEAPEIDASQYAERFIGREGLLADLANAVHSLMERCQGRITPGQTKAQAFWYHGFGGMGKSWFLRKALLQTINDLPSAKIALIDWDHPSWRHPLNQPPETIKDLLDPIAYRLAQLYSITALDRYWEASHRAGYVKAELSKHQERFNQHVRELSDGKTADHALQLALIDKKLWSDDRTKLAKSLDDLQRNVNLRKEVFNCWFDRGGGSSDDPEALLRPDSLRIRALQDTIRSIATENAPLILGLDTCELLSVDLERVLRQLLAPLCDGKLPFLVLFGSRLQPDAAEPSGSKELWRAIVTEVRWRSVPFDEGVRFTVQQIQQSLNKLKPPLLAIDKLAEQLHQITRGVPLALRSLLDLHEGGSNVLSELNLLETSDQSDDWGEANEVDEVIQTVAGRFLLHLSNHPERSDDLKAVIALSLLTKSRRELLSQLWKTNNVRGRLRELATRYALLAEYDLHETVRSFLRRRWRMEDRPTEVGTVVDELYAITVALEFDAYPGEYEYMEILAVKLNLKAWKEEESALASFAPALALALAYNEQSQQLVSLAAEIRVISPRLSKQAKALKALNEDFADRPWWVKPWGNDELFCWMEKEATRSNWSPVEKASLNVLRGLKFYAEGNYKEALEYLLIALPTFPDGAVPRTIELGETLFQIGYQLYEEKKTPENVKKAYEGAIKLHYAEDRSHNNLGLVYQQLKQFDAAEEYFLKAAEIDPYEPLYLSNLGNLYREFKLYEKAEQWCLKALELDQKYATAINDLGIIYQNTERFEAAEEQFSKAAELDSLEPVYPRNLGNLYLQCKRYDEAEQWCLKALELDPKNALLINDLGIIYQNTERFEASKEHYRKAVELEPLESVYPRNLGDLYRQLKRYEEAEQCYRKALELDPKSAAAINGLGIIYQDGEQYEMAEEYYRKAAEFDPLEPIYPTNLGDLYCRRKRYEEAEQCYRKILEFDSKYAPAINGLGMIYQDTELFEAAEEHYSKAAELEPLEPVYPRNLGNLYRQRKRYDEAEMWCLKALELDPKYVTAVNDLGIIYQITEQFEASEEYYRKAAEHEPLEPGYPRNLGDLYIQLKRYEEAEQCYRIALELDPKFAAAMNGLGIIYQYREQYETAEEYYRKAAELDPLEPIYPTNLGNLYRQRKRHVEAEQCVLKALELNPTYATAINGLGLIFMETKRIGDAEEQFRKAAELDSLEPTYPRNLGDLYFRRKCYDEAQQCYRKALELDPKFTAAINGLGVVYQDTERFEAAEEYYRKARELEPSEPIYPTNLGDLYYRRKCYDEAEQCYRNALELNPKHAAAINGLGLIYQDTKQFETAEAEYRKASEIAPLEPVYLINLGRLFEELKRNEEAEDCFRAALKLAPDDAETLNALAWNLFQRSILLDEAEAKAKQAVAIDSSPYFLHTLIDIQISLSKWDEARETIKQWAGCADEAYIAETREYMIATFKRIIGLGKRDELISILRETSNGSHWIPWIAALESVDRNSSESELNHEILEIRKALLKAD